MWVKMFSRQFSALTWKNYIYRKRHFSTVLMELIVPVGMLALLVALKSLFKVQTVDEYIPSRYDVGNPLALNCMFEDPYICNENLVWYCNPDVECAFSARNGNEWNCDGGESNSNATKEDLDALHEELECQPRKIGVAPKHSSDTSAAQTAREFVSWASNYSIYASMYETFEFFESESDFIDAIDRKSYSRIDPVVYSSAVIFDGGYPSWDFTIRLNQTYYKDNFDYDAPYTKGIESDFAAKSRRYRSRDLDQSYISAYFNTHIFTLQEVVQSFIGTSTCRNTPGACAADEVVEVHIAGLANFPNEKHKGPGFWANLSFLFALMVIIAMLYPFSNVIRVLVEEKENRIREGMLIMSLRQDALWISWLFHFYTLLFVIAILYVAVSTALFDYSNLGHVFVYFFLYFTAGTSFCIFISTLFSKTRTAINLGCFLLFGGYFVYLGMDLTVTPFSRSEYLLASLHPAAAFAFGAQSFQEYEENRIGINDSTYNESNDNVYTLGDIYMMLCIDTVYLLALAWYFNKVMPSDFGTPAKWYFIFMPEYWLDCCRSVLWCFAPVQNKAFSAIPVEESETAQARGESEYVENVTEDLQAQISAGVCVDIRGLRKVFQTTNGVKVAVDRLNLSMFSGQITALLGHNGAGKTTLISMLTGLIPSDSGTAIINGHDLRNNMDHIRETLGVCPQHDVLFDYLTVSEHLELYAKFKGVTNQDMAGEVEGMLKSIGLTEKRHYLSPALSGGQKRKLSVGIAFIGGSKVVMLDEPTSGMDPYSRRFTWNVIRQHREGRVIILTTHFMDEADLLGDRIAIMGGGKLLCCGSSLYLKNTFGVGYNMTVEKDPAKFNTAAVMDVVQTMVPEATVLTDVAGEIVVQLPFSGSSHFESLFIKMDAHSKEWGIESYGMSVTTLEEVFIKVATKGSHEVAKGTSSGQMEGRKKSIHDSEDGHHSSNSIELVKLEASGDAEATSDAAALENGQSNRVSTPVAYEKVDVKVDSDSQLKLPLKTPVTTGERLAHTLKQFSSHVIAMFTKRRLYFKRDIKTIVLQYALPTVFLLTGLIIIESVEWIVPQPSKDLKAHMYNDNINSNYLPTVYPQDFTDQCPWCSEDYNSGDDDQADDFYGSGLSACLAQCNNNEYVGYTALMSSISNSVDLPLKSVDPNAYDSTVYTKDTTNTIQAVSRLVLDGEDDFKAAQVGAISFGYQSYEGDMTNTFRYDNNNGTLSYVTYGVHSNYTAVHGAPLYASLVGQAVARFFDPAVTVRSRIHPLPYTYAQKEIDGNYVTNIIPFYILLGIPFSAAAWASYIVREKEVRAKQQQLVSGVSVAAYWLANWLWDIVSWVVTASIMIILVVSFPGNPLITKPEPLKAFCAAMYLTGPAMVGMTYLTTLIFKTPAGAQVVTLSLVFFEGLLLSELGIALRLYFSEDIRSLYKNTLRYLFLLFPPFALGEAVRNLAFIDFFSFLELGGTRKYKPLDWDITGANLTFLAIFGVGYIFLTVLIEYVGSFSFCSLQFGQQKVMDTAEEEATHHHEVRDQDVLAEEKHVRQIVERGEVASAAAAADSVHPTMVLVDGFKKVYPNGKFAVRGVSLDIPNGECFGLLGVNGAGKSTLLGMLNGDISPSQGQSWLGGLNLATHVHEVRKNVGFCPQFDALLELLTGREHLHLYGRIKGIPDDRLEAEVEEKIKRFDLTEFADRLAGTYSGGNKRKLSVAIAMIGDPSIIFLDEPSTGMDPLAKRFLWSVITETVTKHSKCALVLTTHSMEECEALCSRIGIMVSGVFRCLGSVQRLRSKYGQGFQLEIGFAVPSHEVLAAKMQHIAQLLQLNVPATEGAGETEAAGGVDLEDIVLSEKQVGDALRAAGLSEWVPNPAAVDLSTAPAATTLAEAVPELADPEAQVSPETLTAGTLAPAPPQQHQAPKQSELATTLHVLGGINVAHFASWWIFEENFHKLSSLLIDQMGAESVVVHERQGSRVRMEIPTRCTSLSKLFGLLEPNKVRVGVQDYCISQTSLEQIFNHFAAQQEEEHLEGTVM